MNTTHNAIATLDKAITEKIHLRRRVFTGNENHHINLTDASRLTKRYRDSVPADAMKGGYFGRVIFEKVLAQEGCVGIRCYFAAFDDRTPTIVLAGVEKTGNDLWEGVLGEDVCPCPPFCSEYNPLNSNGTEQALTLKRKTMVFTGQENHLVTLAEASRYTRNFRSMSEAGAMKGGYLGRGIFEQILSQAGCTGIRLYFAINDDGTRTFVLVGVSPNGNDIFQGVLGEDVCPCPPFCSEINPLNG